MDTIQILDCGHQVSEHSSISTGYGTDKNGKTFCYNCCANNDKEIMRKDGKIVLYFHGGKVSNWPSSLVFTPTYTKESRTNWGLKRHDFWFDFESTRWHGYQIGHNNEIAYCKLIKSSK